MNRRRRKEKVEIGKYMHLPLIKYIHHKNRLEGALPCTHRIGFHICCSASLPLCRATTNIAISFTFRSSLNLQCMPPSSSPLMPSSPHSARESRGPLASARPQARDQRRTGMRGFASRIRRQYPGKYREPCLWLKD
jgi:hypothetical protein